MRIKWTPRQAADVRSNPKDVPFHGCVMVANAKFDHGRIEPLRRRLTAATLTGMVSDAWSVYWLRRVHMSTQWAQFGKSEWLIYPGPLTSVRYQNFGPYYIESYIAAGQTIGLHRFSTTAAAQRFPLITEGAYAQVYRPANGTFDTTRVLFPEPNAAPTLVATGSPAAGEQAQTWYGVYTFVYRNAETGALAESAPSPISAAVSATRSQSLSWTTPATTGWFGGLAAAIDPLYAVRYYLTQGTDAAANFYLTGEQTGSLGTLTFSIYPTAISVGRLLDSQNNSPGPTAAVFGVSQLPAGNLVGMTASGVAFSEPDKYYSWPADWERRSGDRPRAVGCFDNTVVVATTDKPLMLQGVSPEAMQSRWLDMSIPCGAAGTFVDGGGFVGWASTEGYWVIDASGVRNLTAKWVAPSVWAALRSRATRATLWGTSIALHIGRPLQVDDWPVQVRRDCIMVIPLDGSPIWWLTGGITAATGIVGQAGVDYNDSVYFRGEGVDPATGNLSAVVDGPDGKLLMEFDRQWTLGGVELTERDPFDMLTGVLELPRPMNFGYLRVTGHNLAVRVTLYEGNAWNAFVDVYESGKIYPLPIGTQHREIRMRVYGLCDWIDSVEIASRASDLTIG